MKNLKHKIYEYEVNPPAGLWEAIAAELDKNVVPIVSLQKHRNKYLYFSIAAAASVAVIIFSLIFFNNASSDKKSFISKNSTAESSGNAVTMQKNTSSNSKVLITIPDEHVTTQNKPLIAQNRSQKGPNVKQSDDVKQDIPDGNKVKDQDINSASPAVSQPSTYVTIAGPEGSPVKVSTKVIALMDSSDKRTPPKPSWNKKVNEWREIMKGSTLAPTPGNFLDIIELTKSLKDKKP